jgi:predicted phage-related endonuclease
MIKHYLKLQQGTPEWQAARIGLITASEVKLILTPTLKIAANAETKKHLYELLAQRISGHVEPYFESYDMERGHSDEFTARELYKDNIEDVAECGFITNDDFGFTLGYSPDGLVGDDGLIECKSRRQKYQVQTLTECVPTQIIPSEYMMQIQTGLMVSGRKWCDFLSYSGGLVMPVIRVFPDSKIQGVIIEACAAFEEKIAELMVAYEGIFTSGARLIATERVNREFGDMI